MVQPLCAFAKYYVLKGGWREGVRGLVLAVSGAYGTFLQDAKLWERWRDAEHDLGRATSNRSAPNPTAVEREATSLDERAERDGMRNAAGRRRVVRR